MASTSKRRGLEIALGGGTLICLFAGFASDGNWASLFLNLATSGITIFVTIAIVEKLLKDYESKRTIGPRFVAFREVCWINNRLLGLIETIIIHSTPANAPVVEIFSIEVGASINTGLLLQSNAPVYPATTWESYLREFLAEQQREIQQITMRYSAFLPFDIIESLSEIENAVFFRVVSIPSSAGPRPIIGLHNPSPFVELGEYVKRLNQALLEIEGEFRSRRTFIAPRRLDDNYIRSVNASVSARHDRGKSPSGRWEAVRSA